MKNRNKKKAELVKNFISQPNHTEAKEELREVKNKALLINMVDEANEKSGKLLHGFMKKLDSNENGKGE